MQGTNSTLAARGQHPSETAYLVVTAPEKVKQFLAYNHHGTYWTVDPYQARRFFSIDAIDKFLTEQTGKQNAFFYELHNFDAIGI